MSGVVETQEQRWEIVVIAPSVDPDEIANVLRDAAVYIAESFGYEVKWDIAAFDPKGECVSEYVHDPEEDEEPASDGGPHFLGHLMTKEDKP